MAARTAIASGGGRSGVGGRRRANDGRRKDGAEFRAEISLTPVSTENGLIVWDDAFARALEQLIRRDIEPQNSWVVAMRPEDEQAETAIEAPPDSNTEFLPWFYGSTSVYELAPGKEPLRPGEPGFYRHYYSVGSFPEVIRTRRQINVLFLGSFFGFLEPIL